MLGSPAERQNRANRLQANPKCDQPPARPQSSLTPPGPGDEGDRLRRAHQATVDTEQGSGKQCSARASMAAHGRAPLAPATTATGSAEPIKPQSHTAQSNGEQRSARKHARARAHNSPRRNNGDRLRRAHRATAGTVESWRRAQHASSSGNAAEHSRNTDPPTAVRTHSSPLQKRDRFERKPRCDSHVTARHQRRPTPKRTITQRPDANGERA